MSKDKFDMEIYYKAAREYRKVFEESRKLIKPGASVLEICEWIESQLVSRGLSLAFPVNISINSIAAHYTARSGDTLMIKEGDVVKVDMGAHLKGHIIDAAYTMTLDEKWESLVECARDSVALAIKMARPGTRTSEIGAAVEKFIKEKGFRPIDNLTGHQIKLYTLHGSKSVPAVGRPFGAKMKEGEVYAIEIFPSTGKGHVHDLSYGYIYSFLGPRPVKSASARKVLRLIMRKYPRLPFAERWVSRDLGMNAAIPLKLLTRAGAVYEYKVLSDVEGSYVAQEEHTIIIREDGAEIIA